MPSLFTRKANRNRIYSNFTRTDNYISQNANEQQNQQQNKNAQINYANYVGNYTMNQNQNQNWYPADPIRTRNAPHIRMLVEEKVRSNANYKGLTFKNARQKFRNTHPEQKGYFKNDPLRKGVSGGKRSRRTRRRL